MAFDVGMKARGIVLLKLWRRTRTGFGLFLALSLALMSCKGEQTESKGKAHRRFRSSTVAVRVAPVKRGRLVYTIFATGTAIPETVIKLSARTEGQVLRLDVREGDRVEKGQVLVRQDDAISRHQFGLAKAEVQAARSRVAKLLAGNRPEEIAQVAAQVAQAKALAARVRAEVDSSRAKKNEAKTNADMYERMFRQGVVSPQRRLASRTLAKSTEADQAEMEAKLEETEAALQAARAKLRLIRAGARKEDIAGARSELLRDRVNAKLLRVRMEHARTVSPIAGIVSERRVEPGDLARVGTHMITLVNTERLKIRTQISELDLPKVKVGQTTAVTFDAYPGRKFPGRVIRIFPAVDPASRQATIEVGLDNPGGALPSGLLARLTLTSRSTREGLIIPKAALVRRVRGGRHEVFVAKKSPPKGSPSQAARANGRGKPQGRPHRKDAAAPAGAASPNGTPPGLQKRKRVQPAAVPSGGRFGKGPARAKQGGRPARPGHIAESRRVVAGEVAGDWAEVRSGLKAGDLVIIKGQNRLRPGSSIKIAR